MAVFSVDPSTPIQSTLDPSFIIGEGDNIRPACHQGDCRYVAKSIRPVPFHEEGCYTPADVIRNEILISEEAGRLGIGPKIYARAQDPERGILIMDRYDGTLDDLLYAYQQDKSIPMLEIFNRIRDLLIRLHSAGIVHRDLHPGNIFYTRDGQFAIGDYGNALRTDYPLYREIDWYVYQSMINLVNRIRMGTSYERGTFYEVTPPPSRIFEPTLIWRGRVCNDWI